MARKDYFVAKDTPHPLYRTRMLTAGVPIPLDASAARLYGQLGVKLSEEAPKVAAKAASQPAKAPSKEPKAPSSSKPRRKKAPTKKKS